MEARTRPEGIQHIALTVNILWQIWKARNEKEFEDSQKASFQIIHKAQEEWLEFVEPNEGHRQVSIPKTDGADNRETIVLQQGNRMEGSKAFINIRVKDHTQASLMAVEVMTFNENNQLLARWSLKEFASKDKILDEAMAIRLVLAKAKLQQWDRIEVGIKQQKLIRMLKAGLANDIRLVELMEDIKDLSCLFKECSFVSGSNSSRMQSVYFSDEVSSFPIDEEVIFSM